MYSTTAATAFALTSFLTFTNAAVHTVNVGDGGLVFKPDTLNPAVGDTVIFKLFPQHNVVSGSFSSPCQSGGNASFFSGPFSDTNNGAKKFVVNVTTTQPVYYYCAVQKHCQSGMVGGWNLPSSGNDIKAYASAAARVSSASAPSALAGGRLLDDSQLGSVTSNATQPSSSPSGSVSVSSGSVASPTSGSPSASRSGGSSPSSSSPQQTKNAALGMVGPEAVVMGLGVAAMFL